MITEVLFQYFWKFTGHWWDEHLGVFWGGGGDESSRWGHSPRMRSGGSGDEGSLPNSFGWEFMLFIKTHFYRGALTSHFMEEHSSPTSIFPVFMMTSSNGNMFRVTSFYAGNSPATAGIHRSPVNSPHTDQWCGALMISLISAWTGSWVNNQDAGDLRRHHAHNDVTVMWCQIVIQWSGAAMGSFGIQRVTLVQFWIGKMGQIGGFHALWKKWPQIWHTALPWLPFLEI